MIRALLFESFSHDAILGGVLGLATLAVAIAFGGWVHRDGVRQGLRAARLAKPTILPFPEIGGEHGRDR
jgi:hypothetical protein